MKERCAVQSPDMPPLPSFGGSIRRPRSTLLQPSPSCRRPPPPPRAVVLAAPRLGLDLCRQFQ